MSAYLASGGLIGLGLLLLIAGGDLLVRGASELAAVARISPVVIGLTVVAFGTSAPELAVSIQAALTGSSTLALGNVVGSNIVNVLLILGFSALVAPLVVASRLVRIDVPLLVVASFLILLLGIDGRIGRFDGMLLFAILLVYIVWSIRQGRRESAQVVEEFESLAPRPRRAGPAVVIRDVAMIVGGLIVLTLGARWLVAGGVDVARALGVREMLIGLTIIAIGTSLPELVTSVVASVRGERDIAVGNVVGSNIFNILAVLGLSSIVAPQGIDVPAVALRLDIPVMTAVAVACLPVFFTGWTIARWEGAVFVGYYVAYTAYLLLDAMHGQVNRTFTVILLGFVLPLTVITLAIGVFRFSRRLARQSDAASGK